MPPEPVRSRTEPRPSPRVASTRVWPWLKRAPVGGSSALVARRDALAGAMLALLRGVVLEGAHLDPARVQALVEQSAALLGTTLV